MACHTQEEIAEATDVPRKTIADWMKEFIEKLGIDNLINPPDFDPPLYNVWKQPTVSKWLSRTLKEEKERKKETAFNLWLACHTQEEIADSVDSPQQTIADWMKDFTETSISEESVKWTDFEVPIYNVWKQQTRRLWIRPLKPSNRSAKSPPPCCWTH